MSNILECKLNELNDYLKELQAARQKHLDTTVQIEDEMRKVVFKKEQLKREYDENNRTN